MKHSPASNRRIGPALLACALSLLSAAAFAQQTIYKQVMPDGRVIYTDEPNSKAAKQTKIPVDTKSYGASSWSATQPGLKPGLSGVRSTSAIAVPGMLPGTTIAALPPLPGSGSVADTSRADAGAEARRNAERSRQQEARDLGEQITKAQTEYDTAVAEVESGKAPIEGERTANASGGSRLNDKFSERQSALVLKVHEARAKLQALRDVRDRRSGN